MQSGIQKAPKAKLSELYFLISVYDIFASVLQVIS